VVTSDEKCQRLLEEFSHAQVIHSRLGSTIKEIWDKDVD
jgi:hypothetical protein